MPNIPREVDLLVVGAGAGGMTAALTASILGLDVLLVEKAEVVGGTTARSAGSVWIPNSLHSTTGDTREQALRYLQRNGRQSPARGHGGRVPGPGTSHGRRSWRQHTDVHFRAYAHHPDYLPSVGGSTTAGRVLEPVPFDGRALGRDFALLRPPLPEFTVLGGMMVDRTDIGHLLGATRSLVALRHAARIVLRHGTDRLWHARGTRLVMGNALAGRLFHSLLRRNVPVLTSTSVTALTHNSGSLMATLQVWPQHRP